MKNERPRNKSASVRDRLLQIAKEHKEEFQLTLTRYAIQRLLYRISRSDYQRQFVLKGANLFAYWMGETHRPTRDLDLLGQGDPEVARLKAVFVEICQQEVEEDALLFQTETVAGTVIREEEEYEGVRITLNALLGNARIPVQIDIGFGDAITPQPQEVELPSLLGLPAPRLLTYPKETVVAEKSEAIVQLGLSNSRLKDFFDLWYLATHFDFDGTALRNALHATFFRRKTPVPLGVPPALTAVYYHDPARQTQWQAFLRKNRLSSDNSLSLEETIAVLLVFLSPLFGALRNEEAFRQTWNHTAQNWQRISNEP